MKKLLALLMLIPTIVFGQQNITNNQIPAIEVTGVAEKEVTPNLITIYILLQENNEKNKLSIEEQEHQLKQQLKANNFDLDKLKVRNINAKLQSINKKTLDVNNKKEYSMVVANTQEAYKLFEILDKINVREAKIIELSHTNIQEYRNDVKILALKAAKDKATKLLSAIGEEIDKPILITEESMNSNPPFGVLSNVAIREYKNENSNNDELEIKPITIKSSIYAKFKIK